jgi:hypothetical protein
MARRHLTGHINSQTHRYHLKQHKKHNSPVSRFNSNQSWAETERPPSVPLPIADSPHLVHDQQDMDIDSNMDVLPPVAESTHHGSDSKMLVPLSDLWDAISNSRYQNINSRGDLFQDLQDAKTFDELLSAMHPMTTSCDDIPLADDTGSDFGIELPPTGWYLNDTCTNKLTHMV